MPTIVYRYGLQPPTAQGELVRAQFRAAHVYYNTLVELDREKRAALRALDAVGADLSGQLRNAHAAVERVLEAIRTARAKVFSAHVAQGESEARAKQGARVTPPELADALALAKATRQACRDAFFAHQAAVTKEAWYVAAYDEVHARALERIGEAREKSGVHWGTYLRVEAAVRAAQSKVPLTTPSGEPDDLRFARWTGEGAVAVQVQQQSGKPPFLGKALFEGQHRQLRLVRVAERDPGRVENPRRPIGPTRFAELFVRVGSEKNRAPLWAVFPLKVSRAIPEDAIVRGCAVRLRRIGPREEWTAEITLEMDRPRAATPAVDSAVAVDLGWRWMGEELRVAAWRSQDGKHGDLRLDAKMVSGLRLHETVHGRRDKEFDEARAKLVGWLDERHDQHAMEGGKETPPWLVEQTATLAQWRAPKRLAMLVTRWKRQRFDGDEAVYTALETWRYHDHHLWAWESEQRTRMLRARLDLYRRLASILAATFKALVLETFDLRKVAKRSATDEAWSNEHANSNRHLAATSELRRVLEQGFQARGRETVRVPAENTTRTCHVCGLVEAFDAAASVERATPCSGCGAQWDQDDNADYELLRRYERHLAAQAAATARKSKNVSDVEEKKPNRWAAVRAKGAERKARRETARKAADNSAEE